MFSYISYAVGHSRYDITGIVTCTCLWWNADRHDRYDNESQGNQRQIDTRSFCIGFESFLSLLLLLFTCWCVWNLGNTYFLFHPVSLIQHSFNFLFFFLSKREDLWMLWSNDVECNSKSLIRQCDIRPSLRHIFCVVIFFDMVMMDPFSFIWWQQQCLGTWVVVTEQKTVRRRRRTYPGISHHHHHPSPSIIFPRSRDLERDRARALQTCYSLFLKPFLSFYFEHHFVSSHVQNSYWSDQEGLSTLRALWFLKRSGFLYIELEKKKKKKILEVQYTQWKSNTPPPSSMAADLDGAPSCAWESHLCVSAGLRTLRSVIM